MPGRNSKYCICFFCGRKVETCSKEPPCRVLEGWLTVSYLKGLEAVEQYNFCCFTCLEKWAQSHIPQVPNVFLESFREESGGGNASL